MLMIAIVLFFVGLPLLGAAGLSAAIDSGIMPKKLLDALNRFCGNEGDERF